MLALGGEPELGGPGLLLLVVRSPEDRYLYAYNQWSSTRPVLPVLMVSVLLPGYPFQGLYL